MTLEDFDRPLDKRGEKTSKLMARHIAKTGIQPGLVLCSPSRRTVQTLNPLRAVWGDDVGIVFANEIYDAESKGLHACLRGHAGDSTSIMVIGHNPSLQDLLMDLCADRKDIRYQEICRKFPAGALAVLSTQDDKWAKMNHRDFALLDFVPPRDLENQ